MGFEPRSPALSLTAPSQGSAGSSGSLRGSLGCLPLEKGAEAPCGEPTGWPVGAPGDSGP